MAVILGMLLGSPNPIVVWTTLSPRAGLRWFFLLAAPPVAIFYMWRGRDWAQLVGIYGIQVIGLLVPLLVLQRFGYKLRFTSAEVLVEHRRPLRFSVRELFTWITAAAAVLAGARLLIPLLRNELSIVVAGLCTAAVGIASAYLVLGRNSPIRRAMAVMITGALAGVVTDLAIPDQDFTLSTSAVMYLTEISYSSAALWVFRRSGYRWMRGRAEPKADDAGPSERADMVTAAATLQSP